VRNGWNARRGWAASVSVMSVGVMMGWLGSTALAHTTIKSEAIEGRADDNAVRISHGCTVEGVAARAAVIAQSVVFPTDQPLLASDSGAGFSDLAQILADGTLAGLLAPIQDRSIFAVQGAKLDAQGAAIGFFGKAGKLSSSLRGRAPFQFNAPRFVADSCVASLIVEVAIADICSAKPPTLEAGKVNLWIPDNGSAFAVQGAQGHVHGIGSPARLTIRRDLQANPLPASCGEGVAVTVSPSPAQVDRDLPIPGYWRIR
jgi:hypothetical protein